MFNNHKYVLIIFLSIILTYQIYWVYTNSNILGVTTMFGCPVIPTPTLTPALTGIDGTSCRDTDSNNRYIFGSCQDKSGKYNDYCNGSSAIESSCTYRWDGKSYRNVKCVQTGFVCPSGTKCLKGGCVYLSNLSNEPTGIGGTILSRITPIIVGDIPCSSDADCPTGQYCVSPEASSFSRISNMRVCRPIVVRPTSVGSTLIQIVTPTVINDIPCSSDANCPTGQYCVSPEASSFSRISNMRVCRSIVVRPTSVDYISCSIYNKRCPSGQFCSMPTGSINGICIPVLPTSVPTGVGVSL